MSAPALLRALLAIAALVVVGCGGGSEQVTTSSVPTGTAQAPKAAGRGERAKSAKPAERSTGEEGEQRVAAPERTKAPFIPPISSAPVEGSKAPAPGVKTVKRGDNSVQAYGTESAPEARTEAAIAVQAYLADRLSEDWDGACSHLAQVISVQLRQLAEKVQAEGKEINGCAGAMEALNEGVPQSALRESARIDEVLSFRVEGTAGALAFLLYRGPPESTLYSVPMYFEDGEWKVGSILPNPLQV